VENVYKFNIANCILEKEECNRAC